jgi:hypothetical protein
MRATNRPDNGRIWVCTPGQPLRAAIALNRDFPVERVFSISPLVGYNSFKTNSLKTKTVGWHVPCLGLDQLFFTTMTDNKINN